ARGAHGDEARARLWRNIRRLARGLGIGEESAASAILPVILGDEAAAMKASAQLLEQGFLVPAIRYPTVARGSARLRITLSALHEENEVEALCDAVRFLVPPSERAAGSAASRR
ncbi:MAG TPA: aminotransferase class I/II-fold pyridoxal phosphate-dependent enzyme, partial [Prosthecobacter sp.]|nr:aminotransferase class I/II-fold pyridoxal phosphate-dependent enzyme [Prosthecobacter sp.]